jgi:hypothetical protein
MAYTQQPSLSPTPDGTVVAMTAPAAAGAGNGDAIPVGSCLLVDNASASVLTLTIKAARTYLGHTLSDTTATVAAGTTALLGPFPADPYGVQSGADVDRVHVEYSSVASVTRAVLSV